MASQALSRTSEHLHCIEIQSFLRGYHAYMDIWTPVIGQTLLVKREPTNPKDKNAVAVYEEDSIVGHVQFTLLLWIFGKRCVNKAVAEVTGEKVNRGAGSYVYHVYGPKTYVIC